MAHPYPCARKAGGVWHTDEFVECDERQSLQVWVGSQFLRCRVVLVVLVAPIAARHTAAEAIHEHLDVAVDLDVPGERVVAAFVLQPAAATLPHNARAKKISYVMGRAHWVEIIATAT